MASVTNLTSVTSFNSTDNIAHIEFKSKIPFPKFRVSVGLMDRTDMQLGPLNENQETFGKSNESKSGNGRSKLA